METKLAPIFTLRALCLKQVSPAYYAAHEDLIKRSSLAAQDYVLSGAISEYDRNSGKTFKTLPGYVAVHKKYNLPYNPNENLITANGINSGLVMDLAWSFNQDKMNKIIDPAGNITQPNRLPTSQVMQVYHNSWGSGIPLDALKIITRGQFEKMLASVQRTK